MPDYFSHAILAETIYDRLETSYKNRIDDKTLYLLGAQGGDVFFAYKIKPTKTNPGRVLHESNAIYLFEQLLHGNPAYVAGFATHYAADCTLHPEVYAYESAHRSPIAHTAFENDLGLYLSRKYSVRRRVLPKDEVLARTSQIYDSIKRVEPLVTVTGVERCLKRHYSYTRFLYRTKRYSYKCDYEFANLDGAIEQTVELGVSAVKSILDGEVDVSLFDKKFLQKK